MKTSLLSSTGSLSIVISSGGIVASNKEVQQYIISFSMIATTVIVEFSLALEFLSNGGHSSMFVNVMASNH